MQSRPMHIMYRVRGLQESTEPFVSTLTSDEGKRLERDRREMCFFVDKQKDMEEGYMLAREMLPCGGLVAVLDSFARVHTSSAIQSGLKLLLMCVRNGNNRTALLENNATHIVLDKLLAECETKGNTTRFAFSNRSLKA